MHILLVDKDGFFCFAVNYIDKKKTNSVATSVQKVCAEVCAVNSNRTKVRTHFKDRKVISIEHFYI